MREAADHLGYRTEQHRVIGTLDIAAALGVAIGLRLAGIGIAATVGIVLLMLGAIRAHVAHRDTPAHVAVLIAVAAIAVAYLFALA